MKTLFIVLTIVSTSLITLKAQDLTKESILKGTWTIDLRPTPDSEAYLEYFVITDVSEKSFKGTFYGSQVTEGLINRAFDVPYLAFSTKDNSSTYYHFVKLTGDTLEGLSYSQGRDLIQPWKGHKKK